MGPTLQEASMGQNAGDSFEEFVRGRSGYLFRLALLLTGQDRAEAEDLLQIALERAYRRRAVLARDRSPEPYVRKVLINASIDRRRALKRRGEHRLDADDHDPAVDDRTGEIANRDLLARSLAQIPPRQRAVLVLRYWCDLSEAEIAATLGCSPGTVKSQAARGLARLRALAEVSSAGLAANREVHKRHE
jgi:RNA polymerase sigma-70 factor (sigma-E family)